MTPVPGHANWIGTPSGELAARTCPGLNVSYRTRDSAADLPHLAVHAFELLLEIALLQRDNILRIGGANELLGKVKRRVDVRFGGRQRVLVDVTCACLS